MQKENVYIIMPVKDAIESAAVSIRAIRQCGYPLCVFDDYSTEENAKRIDELSQALSFSVVHIADKYAHPSPNYRWVLQTARREAIAQSKHLLIVESDVVVRSETIPMMLRAIGKHVGMVAAITHNQENEINFPYEYARRILRKKGDQMTETNKRLSFCCTLLTLELLQALDFERLDPAKNWYDVTISHWSTEKGFRNILMLDNPVLHTPHGSRPWKQLKYTHPIKYYWRKLTQHLDRI